MIAIKILNVMTKIGPIIKDKTNEEKGFDYTIQSIRMGYMTQIEGGAMHFFPVWYFQCKLGEKGITLLALDARNGAVIYMG